MTDRPIDTGDDAERDSDLLRADIDPATALLQSTDDVLDDGDETASSSPAPPLRTRGRFDRGLFIASLAIAVGLVLIAWGFTVARTGDDGIDRPDAIESLQPVENAVQVLQQDRIVVDLEAGYQAELVIDGIEIPTSTLGQTDVDPGDAGQQVDLPTGAVFDRGNAVISFQPVEGAPIESFEQGLHEARVIYWKIEEGRDRALSYRWEFEVV